MDLTKISQNEAWVFWLKQLRDPNVQKAVGTLETCKDPTNPPRCCLGHACHVLIPETRHVKHIERKTKDGIVERVAEVFYGKEDEAESGLLPESVARLLNVTPYVMFHNKILGREGNIYGGYRKMTFVNDNTPMSLSEIADLLEEQRKAGNLKPFSSLRDE